VLIGTVQSIKNGESKRAKVYKTKIELLPAAWIFPRGIVFSYMLHTDQRGYPTICPMFSTFAIVPPSSNQFRLVREGDIDELRRMFDIGLAAPTDREDSYPEKSLLHVSCLWLPDFDSSNTACSSVQYLIVIWQ